MRHDVSTSQSSCCGQSFHNTNFNIKALFSPPHFSQLDFCRSPHNVSQPHTRFHCSLFSDSDPSAPSAPYRTVVSQWVLCQLAMRPEYLAPLREELANVLEEDETGALRLTAQSLREARLMDSFIREVMRLKGDTISAMRYTTCDVPLGNVIIPKGKSRLLWNMRTAFPHRLCAGGVTCLQPSISGYGDARSEADQFCLECKYVKV